MNKLTYIVLLFPLLMMGQTLALPWAHGHGRYTTGGRGYGLYFVTNTNNSGAGSLRQALADADSAGGGNIIFRTSGTVTLSTDLGITGDNITIWGMSAPGDGITVYNDETYIYGQNIIITDMRFRGGDTAVSQEEDVIRIQSQGQSGTFQNYMFDHISVSWGGDENFSVETGTGGGVTVNNMTVQNSIISEPFNSKNVILWGKNISDISFIANYLAHSNERNIRSSTDSDKWEQVNNFIYNYGLGINPTAGNWVDAIGNVFEDGPSTQIANTIHWETCSSGNCPPSGLTDFSTSRLYQIDNTFNGGSVSVSSNISAYTTGTPNVSSEHIAMASSLVKAYVLDNAGARAWLPSGVDDLDAHILADGANGSTGSFPSSEAGTTGLPTLASGTAYTDTDNDGMGDDWEMARWGDLDETYSGDDDADGYLNLEEFMHYRVGKGDAGVSPETSITPTVFRIGSTISPFFYLGPTKYRL
jgi:hypothetical protein